MIQFRLRSVVIKSIDVLVWRGIAHVMERMLCQCQTASPRSSGVHKVIAIQTTRSAALLLPLTPRSKDYLAMAVLQVQWRNSILSDEPK